MPPERLAPSAQQGGDRTSQTITTPLRNSVRSFGDARDLCAAPSAAGACDWESERVSSFRELGARAKASLVRRTHHNVRHLRHVKGLTRGVDAAGGRSKVRSRGRRGRTSSRAVIYLAGRFEKRAARAFVRVRCDAVRTEGAHAYWTLDLRVQRKGAARGALSSTIHLCHAEID